MNTHLTNLPWIKLYIELLFEPKIFGLSDARKWRFVQLLLLAGYLDAEGYLVSSGKALESEMLAWLLHCPVAELEGDLQALAGAHLIELDEAQASWLIPSFAGRQSRPDDEQRRRWREVKRTQRAKHPGKKQPVDDLPADLDEEGADLEEDAPEELEAEAPDPDLELPALAHNLESPLASTEDLAAGMISQLAATLSADRRLDRGRTVALKRRGD
jgi:hypothetical protein